MTVVRTPKSVAAARSLLEHYAELDAALAAIEAERTAGITAANAIADKAAAPLLTSLAQIREKLEPWWRGPAGQQLAGKRKSIELGGCMIGSRLNKPKLVHTFDNDEAALAALVASRFRKATTRTTTSLDKAAIGRLLGASNATSKALAELGFKTDQGDTFILERAEQEGTIASAS